jgi:1D-myo-inositol 3-kinase
MRRGIVVAGNYTHDTTIGGDTMFSSCPPGAKGHIELGGAAAYASAVLRAAGVDFAVVAKVGSDFLYPDRVPPALVVPGACTTTFVDDYRTEERSAALRAAAPALAPEDLRETCEVGLAVAVAGEIPVPTLLRLRGLSRVLLADAQGFVRAFDPSGRVLHVPPAPEVLAALEQVDYLKASRAEAEALDLSRLRRSCTILLTDGPRGCTLLSAAGEIHVPAFPAREIDPTGAGDCFLAGFAVGLLRGLSPPQAARLGNWCGARCTESPGIPNLKDLPADDPD